MNIIRYVVCSAVALLISTTTKIAAAPHHPLSAITQATKLLENHTAQYTEQYSKTLAVEIPFLYGVLYHQIDTDIATLQHLIKYDYYQKSEVAAARAAISAAHKARSFKPIPKTPLEKERATRRAIWQPHP